MVPHQMTVLTLPKETQPFTVAPTPKIRSKVKSPEHTSISKKALDPNAHSDTQWATASRQTSKSNGLSQKFEPAMTIGLH